MIEATVQKRYHDDGTWEWCVCFFGRTWPFGDDDFGKELADRAARGFPEDMEDFWPSDKPLKRFEDL